MRGKTGADREISVNTYTGGFTTMLNHHLRNRNLSLKAVGLLSKMLSLPPDWDYSIRGLATLNTDGIDGIRTAMKELEDEGYVVRVQSRDERGRMSRNKYTVYALPQKEKPSPDLPSSENPTTVKPPPDEPMTEKPTQINTNQVIPKKRNDSLSKYQSINPDGMDAMDERERYEEIIRENLEVDILSQDSRYDIDRVNEIIEVMLDAICSTSPTLPRSAGLHCGMPTTSGRAATHPQPQTPRLQQSPARASQMFRSRRPEKAESPDRADSILPAPNPHEHHWVTFSHFASQSNLFSWKFYFPVLSAAIFPA